VRGGFVFIARPKNEADRRSKPEEFVFPYEYKMTKDLGAGRSTYRTFPAFNHLGFDKVFDAHVRPWKGRSVLLHRPKRRGFRAVSGLDQAPIGVSEKYGAALGAQAKRDEAARPK